MLTPADLDATDSDIGDLPRPRPDSVAYVIFTSGSTGRPKAVTVSHRSAATFVSNIREVARSNTPTRVVQFGSTGFDAIIWEMGVSLGLGGTLLLPKPAERSPGPGLAEYLETSRATHILVPPSVLGTMPSSMSVPTEFFVGGEALRQSLIDRWAGRIHMRNVYGPTETTVVCLVGEQLAVSDPPALGSPVADCVVHVLDKRLAPVQAGEVGELYLTGEMVSWGYITDPPLTACRFVASPYGPPGTRMYGTGDLVRLQRDGGLVHVGRIDQQVKVRGNRIELTEVVTSLESLPYVEVAAVLPIDEGPSLALVGFVKYVDNLPIDSDAVLARLRDELPAAAVPHRLVALDSLPMTINQKVDTKALRAMYARLTHTEDAPADLGTEAAQSDDDVTDRIVAAYRQVLRRADVDPTTDFVTAGGDSISAVSLVAHLRADGIYLSPPRHSVAADAVSTVSPGPCRTGRRSRDPPWPHHTAAGSAMVRLSGRRDGRVYPFGRAGLTYRTDHPRRRSGTPPPRRHTPHTERPTSQREPGRAAGGRTRSLAPDPGAPRRSARRKTVSVAGKPARPRCGCPVADSPGP